MTDTQCMEYLKGGAWSHKVNSDYMFCIIFGDMSANSVYLEIANADAVGVVAAGNYTLTSGVISANYTTVSVDYDFVNWSTSQFRGFQSNVPCIRKYTIVSCSEPYLTLRTENGETFKFERKYY